MDNHLVGGQFTVLHWQVDLWQPLPRRCAYGRHECVAMFISRVELQVALGVLFKRIPNLKLAMSENEIPFSPPTKDLGVAELKVTWD